MILCLLVPATYYFIKLEFYMHRFSSQIVLCLTVAIPLITQSLFAQHEVVKVVDGKRYPVPVETDSGYLNPWPEAEEKRFMEKAEHLIRHYGAQRNSGSTVNEREKDLYPRAMFHILAGKEDEGAKALMQPQQYDPKPFHEFTGGFDFWFGFTLKGQARKYFHFGQFLDDEYRNRFEKAFAEWTRTDPRTTPHPHYKKYDPQKQGWTPERFGNRQIDGRRTDNLYAMTTVTTYLFAEAAGNEDVRQKTWERIREYGVTMYMNGIGEWDSENYLGHTMSAYLNLYDFAEDPTVKMHAKGILDWISTSMAVKYWRGGWGGAIKRDYGNLMVLEGNALETGHLYFDDLGLETDGDRDDVHHITSAYRPPMAVVELARGEIDKPVELLISHPTYENWKTDDAGRSGRDYPDFHETFFIGNHYRFGTLPGGNGGDVSGFSMITENSQRGVDYLKIGHNLGKEAESIKKGKKLTRSRFITTDAGQTNVGQYRNLALYVTDEADADFYLLCAPGSIRTQQKGIQFLQHEKTWIALTPVGMTWQGRDAELSGGFAAAGDILTGKGNGNGHAGFAIEIGEPETHGSFEEFVRNVTAKSRIEKKGDVTWSYTGVNGASVGLKHNGAIPGPFVNKEDQPWILERVRTADEVYEGYPTVWRNGEVHDWSNHFAQYQNPENPEAGPVSLGFKEGRLKVISNNWIFTGSMQPDGEFSFTNKKR